MKPGLAVVTLNAGLGNQFFQYPGELLLALETDTIVMAAILRFPNRELTTDFLSESRLLLENDFV